MLCSWLPHFIDKKSPRPGCQAEHRAADLRRRTRMKRSSLRLGRLDLSSYYFLKCSKIDISQTRDVSCAIRLAQQIGKSVFKWPYGFHRDYLSLICLWLGTGTRSKRNFHRPQSNCWVAINSPGKVFIALPLQLRRRIRPPPQRWRSCRKSEEIISPWSFKSRFVFMLFLKHRKGDISQRMLSAAYTARLFGDVRFLRLALLCYLDATGASRWTSASKRGSFRSGSHRGFSRKSP